MMVYLDFYSIQDLWPRNTSDASHRNYSLMFLINFVNGVSGVSFIYFEVMIGFSKCLGILCRTKWFLFNIHFRYPHHSFSVAAI